MDQKSPTLYGINNCDTCRKARRWLSDHGIEFEWHDIRRDGLSAIDVTRWLGSIGTQKLINRRGRSWRELSETAKASLEAGETDAFIAHPTVIKRPVLVTETDITVGFEEKHWQSLLTQ